jgi:DNA-binding transcriptional ArsR family regulator
MPTEQKQSASQSSASRVMAILDALTAADPADFPDGLTVADVARMLGREKSVVSRQLKGLLESGLVSRGESGRYEHEVHLLGREVDDVADVLPVLDRRGDSGRDADELRQRQAHVHPVERSPVLDVRTPTTRRVRSLSRST